MGVSAAMTMVQQVKGDCLRMIHLSGGSGDIQNYERLTLPVDPTGLCVHCLKPFHLGYLAGSLNMSPCFHDNGKQINNK